MVERSPTTPQQDETFPPAAKGDSAKVNVARARFKGTSRYEIVGFLGQGAMGIVYEAIDRQRKERVALKTLHNFDAAGLYQFKQEFRTLADVLHPNLVHLHELVAGDRDEVFFTMELVEGTNFLEYVHKPGTPRTDYESESRGVEPTGIRRASQRPPSSQGIETDPPRLSSAQFDKLRPALGQLVQGLQALHGAGKLHRDIKPSNVLVTPEGRVVILDFGVATELRRRAGDNANEGPVGTITYMAPEQSAGDAPIAASDWYSVGAMLYEAMVGRPPFYGSAVEVLALKNTTTPVAPSARVQGVPADLDALCMALLDPEPAARPTGPDILRRLGATFSDHPSSAPPAGSEATALVGRERQLGELRAAFEATRAGRSIAVRVSGLAGLGKTALVNRFFDAIESEFEVLVLRGRAYERESVPYKAVDMVIDALSHHLMGVASAATRPTCRPTSGRWRTSSPC
jgi:serine/threonine protein kinase